ncbi:MAG: hypothetical protein ABR589_09400 [Chthoniobacterales bacterium]
MIVESPPALRIDRNTSGQAVVLLIIVLAILGGITWWLFSSKKQNESGAREFGRETVTRLAFQQDRKFLDRSLGDDARIHYPPSFRELLFARFRQLGTPSGEIDFQGDVTFTSRFFEPKGTFRAQINYPNGLPAFLDVGVSMPKGWWQIDYLNLTWNPAPAPPPPPPEVAPSP